MSAGRKEKILVARVEAAVKYAGNHLLMMNRFYRFSLIILMLSGMPGGSEPRDRQSQNKDHHQCPN